MYPPPPPPQFLKNKQNPNPHPFGKVGEIQLWLITTTCFTSLLLKIGPLIIKTLNFEFENVSFTKLPKKILTIKQSNMLDIAVLYPEFFWYTRYMYRNQDFNKSIGECTVRQTDRQTLWLYLAAFQYQTTKQS